MNKEIKYHLQYRLTPSVSMKLQELSKKLKLGKSDVVGLLITKAQLVEDDDGAFQIVDESLVIQKGQPDGN